MWLIDRAMAGLAAQLGNPSGIAGGIVGRMLNRGNRSVVSAGVDAIDLREPDVVVVDVGFGGGVGLNLLLRGIVDGGTVHGVETSATMIDNAGRRFADDLVAGRLHLHHAQMEELPFGDGAVNAVLSTNTIYFIEELAAAAQELARILCPGGRLVLGVGDPAQMAKMPFTRHGFRLRPVDEVIESLRAVGFVNVGDRRVGTGEGAFHLIVAEIAAP